MNNSKCKLYFFGYLLPKNSAGSPNSNSSHDFLSSIASVIAMSPEIIMTPPRNIKITIHGSTAMYLPI